MSKRRSDIDDAAGKTVAVWDRWVRLLHWTLVASVVAAWITGHGVIRGIRGHEVAGYIAAGVVVIRCCWGLMGSPYARFSQFIRGPRTTLLYVAMLLEGRAPTYLGHNPLGGWMIVALISCVACLGLSGYLFTTDMFWGYAWLEEFHRVMSWVLMALAATHVSAVIFMSLRYREKLVAAMFSGRKRSGGSDGDG